MLQLTVKVGQSVEIPGVGTITLVEKSGRRAHLAFDVTKDLKIKLLPLAGAAPAPAK
jgi:hypothetical protein